jgi:aminoglycoside phosphotransferase (APT) family kinase protein
MISVDARILGHLAQRIDPDSPQADRLAQTYAARPSTLNDALDEGRIRKTLEPVWPLPPANEPVLLHGDFWPGNILAHM